MPVRDQLQEIRERVEKATPGPWVSRPYVAHWPEGGSDVESGDGVPITFGGQEGLDPSVPVPADAEFIARSRSDVPLLLDLLDEAVDALAGVIGAYDAWHTYMDRPSHPSEHVRRREFRAERDHARAFLAKFSEEGTR